MNHRSTMANSHGSVSKLNNEELYRLGPDELVQLLRRTDQEKVAIIKEHAQLMKDFNQRMQVHLVEIRSLKEVNHRLQEDNQELQGLCCFLDDERKKERQLAKEWQRFGRYTSGVMKNEVDVSQQKLNKLELHQDDLLRENDELKLLCLNLEQERLESTVDRDQGDGSSNSSSTTDKPVSHDDSLLTPPPSQRPPMEQMFRRDPRPRQHSREHEQNMQYIRQLEERILKYEEEKKLKIQRASQERTTSPSRGQGQRFFRSPDVLDSGAAAKQYRDRSRSPGGAVIADAMKVVGFNDRKEPSHTRDDRQGPVPTPFIHDGCSVSLV